MQQAAAPWSELPGIFRFYMSTRNMNWRWLSTVVLRRDHVLWDTPAVSVSGPNGENDDFLHCNCDTSLIMHDCWFVQWLFFSSLFSRARLAYSKRPIGTESRRSLDNHLEIPDTIKNFLPTFERLIQPQFEYLVITPTAFSTPELTWCLYVH